MTKFAQRCAGRANGKLEKFPLNYIHVFMEQPSETEFVLL